MNSIGTDIITRVEGYFRAYELLDNEYSSQNSVKEQLQSELDSFKKEQLLIDRSLQALNAVKPLLATTAIEKAKALANLALASIFDSPDTLSYSEENSRFFISTPEGDADFQDGTGGGVQAVISFVFQVFLLIKENARLFFALDETFTQLDDFALANFLQFLNKMCESFDMDILLISHDARIEENQVSHLYYIEDGKSIKIK